MDLDISTSSVEETLAARRARRQAIMAKYAGLDSNAASPSPGPTSAVEPPHALPAVSDTVTQPTSATETPVSPWVENGEENVSQSELCVTARRSGTHRILGKRESMSASPTPAAFSLAKDGEEEQQVTARILDDANEQVSAADYDPNVDHREDEEKRARAVVDEPREVEMIEEEEEEDEVDDMFAVLTTDKKKVKKVRKIQVCTFPLHPPLSFMNLLV